MKAARGLVALAGFGLLFGCTKQPAANIIGHWKAEDTQIQSLVISLGPDLEISERELVATGPDLRLAIEKIVAAPSEVTLKTAAGFGWTFFFDGADRMYADIPLVGKIYYRRVAANSRPADAPAAQPSSRGASSSLPIAPQGPQTLVKAARLRMASGNYAEAQEQLAQAEQTYGRTPDILREYAALSSLASRPDDAVRLLDESLRAGFRPVQAIEDDPRFAAVRPDVRYRAVLDRYR